MSETETKFIDAISKLQATAQSMTGANKSKIEKLIELYIDKLHGFLQKPVGLRM